MQSIDYQDFKNSGKNKSPYFMLISKSKCNACRQIKETIWELEADYEINFYDINADNNPMIIHEFNVEYVPKIIYYDGVSLIQKNPPIEKEHIEKILSEHYKGYKNIK